MFVDPVLVVDPAHELDIVAVMAAGLHADAVDDVQTVTDVAQLAPQFS